MADGHHLLVIGAQRCGTTYLADVLEAHPDVAVARPRRPEPKAFLADEPPTRAGYLSAFFGHATSERLLVEKSTSYLEHPEAIARVRDVLGDPLVVVQLRDPVARALSHWRFSRDHGLEDLPLAEALEADLDGSRDWDPARFSVSPFAYVRRGRYAEDLEPWWAAFPGRVVVSFLEELAGSPAAVRALYVTLGLAPYDGPVPTAPVNTSRQPAERLEPALADRLRAYYRTSDTRLEDLLGRRLPWREASA